MSVIDEVIKRFAFIPVLYNDKERKPLLVIVKDLFYLLFKQKTLPTHYFSRHLYRKENKNIDDYIPNKVLLSIADRINDQSAAKVLSNKLFFYLHYSKFFNNLAKVLMYNHSDVFVVDNKSYKISSTQELEEKLRDIVTNKSASKSIFIKKTYDSYGGANTYKINASDFPLQKNFINELFIELRKSAFLYQETIIQHPTMNKINPSCINTLRIDTFINKDGTVELIAPYLRMSISNLYVDNASSGGCFVGIDVDSGKLKKYGYTQISRGGGKILTSHPITNIEFLDFEIPFFKESKEFLVQVASIVPSLRLIGWDIAITESGPVLVEGNNGYDISNHDLIDKGYKKNKVFKKVLQELNINV